MLPLLAELFDHQAWADATMLAAIRAFPPRWMTRNCAKGCIT